MLKSWEGALLGAGAVTDGCEGCAGADLLENGLERIMVDGLLGLNDGMEDPVEGGALGVNDGLEGANDGREGENDGCDGVNEGLEGVKEGDLLGLNDGPEGAIDDDLPEPNEPPEDPGLGLGLMASRLDPTSFRTELRLERPCARREVDDPISRAAVSATDITAALRSFLSPATNMAVSFPSPAPPTPGRGTATQKILQ